LSQTLKQWLAAINSHNVSALAALMAPDHVFVDSLGNRVTGAKSMEAGWRGYFTMCPDYWIRADQAIR
jgi:ketosteroid isomerase-like protein